MTDRRKELAQGVDYAPCAGSRYCSAATPKGMACVSCTRRLLARPQFNIAVLKMEWYKTMYEALCKGARIEPREFPEELTDGY